MFDGLHRHRKAKGNGSVDGYRSATTSSSSSSSSSSFQSDGDGDGDHAVLESTTASTTTTASTATTTTYTINTTTSRELLFDEVTKISDTKCSLSTSLQTDYKGWDTASGIMFTVQPLEAIELLTLEFQAFENYAVALSSVSPNAQQVQVYYKMGTFSGVMNDPSEWSLIADTNPHLIPPPDISKTAATAVGAIIPANEFQSVIFEVGQVYSIYISISTLVAQGIKINPADGLVGDVSAESESLQVQTGVSLEGTFPAGFKEAADFNGVLHYRLIQLCDDSAMVTTTPVELLFAINEEPTEKVINSLTDAVAKTLLELFSTNENLVRYSEDHLIDIASMKSGFQGRIEEKCPTDYDNCGMVSTTVSFKHSHTLDPGLLEMEILSESKQLDAQVASYTSPVQTEYVENPMSKGAFVITIMGVPNAGGEVKMNDVQKRYFEEVTMHFLRELSTLKVFTVTVNDEIPETPFIEDGQQLARTRRRLFSPGSFFDFGRTSRRSLLRRRKLQDTTTSTTTASGRTQIITEIAAEGSMKELRTKILEGIGIGEDKYISELIAQQMRPGEINEQDYGDFFSELTNIQVKPQSLPSTNGGENGGTSTPGGNEIGPLGTTGGGYWVIVCIVLIVLSLLWILYRVYRDCFYSPYEEPLKLNTPSNDEKDDEKKSPTKDVKKPLFGRMKMPCGLISRRLSDTEITPPLGDSSDEECNVDEAEPFVHNTKHTNNNNKSPPKKPRSFHKLTTTKSNDNQSPKTISSHETATRPGSTRQDLTLASEPNHPKNGRPSSMNKILSQPKGEPDEHSKGSKGSPKRKISTTSKDRSSKSKNSSFHDDADVKSWSAGEEESSSDEESTSEYNYIERVTITSKDSKCGSKYHSDSDSDSDESTSSEESDSCEDIDISSSQGSEVVERSHPIAKQKMRRLSIDSAPKQSRSPEVTRKTAPKKVEKVTKSVASNNNNNRETDIGKDMSVATKSTHTSRSDGSKKPQKKPLRRNPSVGKSRGIAASKSMPMEKRNRVGTKKKNIGRKSVNRTHSEGSTKAKKSAKRSNHSAATKPPSSDESTLIKKNEKKRRDKKRGIRASKSMPMAKKKAEPKPNVLLRTNMVHDSTSDSDPEKKRRDKKRGIRASKSMPMAKKKAEPKPNVLMWTNMVHDSSESDSESSGYVLETSCDDKSVISALTTSTKEKNALKQLRDEERHRIASLRKSKEVRKSYGKVGKIQFKSVASEKKKNDDWSYRLPDDRTTLSKLDEMLM